jgi:outer membrane protein TolC
VCLQLFLSLGLWSGAAFAVDTVTEPGSPNQPSLARPDSNQSSPQIQTPQPQPAPTPGTHTPSSTDQFLNPPARNSLTSPDQRWSPVPAPLGKQPPMNEPFSSTKWPENVFTIGHIDLDMLTPGQIKMQPPQAGDLVPVGNSMNPLRLEASIDEPISLHQTLNVILDRNLPIRISREQVQIAKWHYLAALGKFLPDFENEFQDQAQQGALSINGALFINIHNPFVFTRTGLRQYVYRGGSVLYGAMRQKHLSTAAKFEDQTTISDALLEGTKRYYAMLLEQVLLQIRVKSVQASNALQTQNDWLKNKGILTKLEVLQAQAQVARDKQLLIHEQIARRNAAIKLASYLDEPTFANFVFLDSNLTKTRLVAEKLNINTLLQIASQNRPELQVVKQQKLAAKNNIVIASAPLQPKASFFGNIIGSGATLAPSYTNVPPGFDAVALAAKPAPANVAGNISLPLPPVVLGSAVPLAPSVQNVVPAGFVPTPAQQISRRIRGLFTAGFNMEWTLGGMGTIDAAEIQAAKAEARQATLKETDQTIKILEEVRTSYLNSLDAEARIEQTTAEVAAAAEELRFAQERMANGVGTSVDVINAQRDYTNSLVNKAYAIIDFNVAQVQVLRDIGVITVDRVCSGHELNELPKPSKRP